MLDWKSFVRPCYYAATLPYRWWIRRVAEASGRAAVVVLAYHRIADDRATPWTIANRTFARHIDWLADRARARNRRVALVHFSGGEKALSFA